MGYVQPPLLLETVRIEEGEIYNLPYHQKRMDRSRSALMETPSPLQLSSWLHIPDSHGLYRCRILYSQTIEKIEYLPYTPKPVKVLKTVDSDISYRYKYANRSKLDALLHANPTADEVIIIQDGLVTDTTIANLAFFKEGKWFTPKTPLLEGTMRAKLLDKNMLEPREIRKEDLSDYSHVALINAMIGFKILNSVTIV